MDKPIALTEDELRRLCDIYNPKNFLQRDLDFLESCSDGTYGNKSARIIRDSLIPLGFLVEDTSARKQNVYIPSEMSKTGTYIAIID